MDNHYCNPVDYYLKYGFDLGFLSFLRGHMVVDFVENRLKMMMKPDKHHWTKHLAQEFFFGSICCSGSRSVATTFCRNNGSWDIVFFVMWSLQTRIFFKIQFVYLSWLPFVEKSYESRERER
jgi:hypothetical protein